MTPGTLLRSSALRMALLYASLFIAAVVLVLVLIYATTVGYMDAQTDAVLESDVRGLLRQCEQEGEQGLAHSISERVAQHPLAIKRLAPFSSHYQSADSGTRLLPHNFPPKRCAANHKTGAIYFRTNANGRDVREEWLS